MSRFLEKFFALPLIAMLAATTACGVGDESRWPRLRVIVAEEARPFTSNLGHSLNEYKSRMGVIIDLEYASGAHIPDRLARDPKPDLVVFCDPALASALTAQKRVDARQWLMERKRDRIAVVTRPDTTVTLARLEDLARPGIKRIGAPRFHGSDVGSATDTYLRRVQLMSSLAPRLTHYADQAAVARAIESGVEQVGFMRESYAVRAGAGRLKIAMTIDHQEGLYPPYVALAVCEGSARPAAAHQAFGQFEAFFRGPETLMIDATPGQGNMINLDNMAS